MYKITVVPFTKMLNSQSAFMPSSWIKNKNVTKLSKIIDFGPDLERMFDSDIRINYT